MEGQTRKLVIWCLAVVCIGCGPCGDASGQIYKLSVPAYANGRKIESTSTAVCVGFSQSGKSMLVTARHNVADAPQNTHVSDGKRWIQASRVRMHPTADVAVIELNHRLPHGIDLVDPSEFPAEGTDAICRGLGPQMHRTGRETDWPVTIFDGYLMGQGGLHPVTGDSGGPVIAKREDGKEVCCGIVVGYYVDQPSTRRDELAHLKPQTAYVDSITICRFIETQFNGNCPTCPPMYTRPVIRQPVVGLPVGPPRIEYVGTTPIQPDTIPGKQGPPGPAGPPGKDGQGVSVAQVEEIVGRWLEANREALRGPAGRSPDLTDLKQRLDALERTPQKFAIADGNRIIQRMEYEAGETVVFDLSRFKIND